MLMVNEMTASFAGEQELTCTQELLMPGVAVMQLAWENPQGESAEADIQWVICTEKAIYLITAPQCDEAEAFFRSITRVQE